MTLLDVFFKSFVLFDDVDIFYNLILHSMGANLSVCLDKDSIMEVMDGYFISNYVWLFFAAVQTFMPFGIVILPINVIMFFVVEIYMYQVGALVDCAITYQSLGPDTNSQFTYMSSYYSAYALFSLLFGTFIQPMITTFVYLSGPILFYTILSSAFLTTLTVTDIFGFFTFDFFGFGWVLYVP